MTPGKSAILLIAVSLAAQNLAAPPWVRQAGVVNAAGQLPVDLPGGALAPGALIAIDGLRFVPAETTVGIQTSGGMLSATVLHATTEKILARMPDFRDDGIATLFVGSRGKRSVGTPLHLTHSAFGIFTVGGKSWGQAAAVLSPEGPRDALPVVRAGSRVTIYGTGLGRATAQEIEVFVGDHKASGVRRGGSKGLDRLSFQVPPQTPAGCAVPVIVRTGDATSNSALLRVGGRSGCSEPSNWYTRLHAPGKRTGAAILLRSDVILELAPGKPVPFTVDNAFAGFSARPAAPGPRPFDAFPPPGQCVAWAGSMDSNDLVLPSFAGTAEDPDLDLGPAVTRTASDLEDLDAGSLSIEGSLASHVLNRSRRKPRVYTALLGGNPPITRVAPTPLFLAPSDYRIVLEGGRDVGAAKVTVPVVEPIRWRNRDSVAVLDRRKGIDLEWTAPQGYTAVVFAWNIDRRSSFGGLTFCRAPRLATTFHIPATAVANLPATRMGGSELSLGFAGVAAVPADPPLIPASGIDEGRAVYASLSGRTVVVQ